MRLGKRERAAKRERLRLAVERHERIAAVTGPRLPTGFDRWPVGKPSASWGFLNGKAGAPRIRPFWKAVRLIPKAGSVTYSGLYQDATALLSE